MLSTRTERDEWRRQANAAVDGLSRAMLLVIIDSRLRQWEDACPRAYVLAAARRELVRRYPCRDCGAAAGDECKPEYGCETNSRRPASFRCDVDESAGLRDIHAAAERREGLRVLSPPAASAVRGSYDPGRRRRGVRRGRERGCWVYIPGAELEKAGYRPDEAPPFYRGWGGIRGGLTLRLSREGDRPEVTP